MGNRVLKTGSFDEARGAASVILKLPDVRAVEVNRHEKTPDEAHLDKNGQRVRYEHLTHEDDSFTVKVYLSRSNPETDMQIRRKLGEDVAVEVLPNSEFHDLARTA